MRPRADILRPWFAFTIARRCRTRVLAADRLQKRGVPVEIKELLLTTGERAHIDGLGDVDTRALKRGTMCNW